ncbi:MAG: formylglycine-generating enzyme family protein, partial [Acetobacteraceae bacterium]
LLLAYATIAAPSAHADDDMHPNGRIAIDRTEVSVAAFRRCVDARHIVTMAERQGGGSVFEAGGVRKPGWTWRAPFGEPADELEPAVHVTFDEAAAYCHWAGKRLPTDAEWLEAAHTERRPSPTPPFQTGATYLYPTGERPNGANCLRDCGPIPFALDRSARLNRGIGPARVGTTQPGVNGLYDMGANVWEWVDTAQGNERITRGGSWWYGAAQMRNDHRASKPPETAVVYIGFRCAQDRRP